MLARIALTLFIASALPLGAENNPGKCPACSFTAVQQPYEAVRVALVAGDVAKAKAEAAKLRVAANGEAQWAKSAKGRGPELVKPWSNIASAAAALARAASLGVAQQAFAEASVALRNAMAIAERDDFLVVYCPTVKLSWVQPKGKIGNPYRPARPHCGNVVNT